MKVEQETDDLVALAALRLALETRTPEQLMAACEAGDAEALDALCSALPAIRRGAGLSIAEFMGRDLAAEFGLEFPSVH
jgi:hypothetical protein